MGNFGSHIAGLSRNPWLRQRWMPAQGRHEADRVPILLDKYGCFVKLAGIQKIKLFYFLNRL
jgi:hypothetical protein